MIENSNISQRVGSHQLKNPEGYFERKYAEKKKNGSFEGYDKDLIGTNIQ